MSTDPLPTAAPDAVAPVLAACSFCGRDHGEVGALVAGPGVFICDRCIDLCQLVLDSTTPTAGLLQLRPWRLAESAAETLAALPRVAAAGSLVEANLAGWVGRARELGATWAAIGAALGMTRQSAWERFATAR